MRHDRIGLICVLALAIIMGLPTTIPGILRIPRVYAVSQTGSTSSWSPFGPREDQVLYSVYSDFQAVFAAFEAGQVDSLDWEIPKAKLCTNPAIPTCYPVNPDYFVTSPQSEFSIMQLDLNHQAGAPFLGKVMAVARTTTSPASCIGTVNIAATCATPPVAPGTASLTLVNTVAGGDATHFQAVIDLVNIEEGGLPIQDQANMVTATVVGQTSPFVKADDSDPNPTGTYTLPLLPGGVGISYTVATTVYSGSVALATSGTTQPVCLVNQKCTFTLAVNYNSFSAQKQTVASIEIGRALAHLMDKLNLLPNAPALLSCDDLQVSKGQNLMTPAPGAGSCGNPASSPSSALISADCAAPGTAGINYGGYINPNEHPWFSTTCGTAGSPSPVSLYHLLSNTVAIGGCTPPACPTNSLGVPIPGTCTVAGVSTPCFPSQGGSFGPPPGGYANTVDLRATCDHLVIAGFTIVPEGASCADVAIGNVVSGVTAHLNDGGFTIQFFISTDQNRAIYGQVFADALQFLYGYNFATGGQGTICYGIGLTHATCANPTPLYYNIAQVTPIVFAATTNWNIYTGKWGLTPTPDHLFGLYYSQIGSACGGKKISLPNNYGAWCDPAYDTQTFAGEFPPLTGSCTTALNLFQCYFQAAASLGATRGMTIAIGNNIGQFAALNGWNYQRVGNGLGSSLVSVLGRGFGAGSGFMLNMRQVPGSQTLCTSGVPENPPGCTVNSLYLPGGGNPALIRRSLAQPTLHLSPYTASSPWERELLAQLFDSMLFLSPNTGGSSSQLLDWMTGNFGSFGIGHTSCTGGLPRCPFPVGTTFQQWNLRQPNWFQDGIPVTADDVCFSILSYRDVPSVSFFSSVSHVLTCSHTDQFTVQVTLSGGSPFFEQGIGLLPIIPAHIWGSVAGWPTGPYDSAHEPAVSTLASSTASTLSFDPVAAGIMVGDGPWVCNPSAGVSVIPGQTSCSQNANGSAGGQALGPGGRILLDRNVGYTRCCDNLQAPETGGASTNLQILEWVDKSKIGKIDPIYFASTIIGQLAACFDQGAASITNFMCTQDMVSYWASPLYSSWASGAAGTVPGTVDIGDIATAASVVSWSGITTPYVGTPSGPFTATAFSGPNGDVLQNLDPVTDPYVIYSAGTGSFPGPYNTSPGVPIGYFQGCYRVLGTTNQIQCSVDTSPTGPPTSTASLTSPGRSTITATPTQGTGNFAGKTLYTFTGTFAAGNYAFSVASYSTTIAI